MQALPDRLWSVDETAEFLQISVNTLYQLNHKGTGPRSFKVGRYRRYDPRDIAAYLAAGAQPGFQAVPA